MEQRMPPRQAGVVADIANRRESMVFELGAPDLTAVDRGLSLKLDSFNLTADLTIQKHTVARLKVDEECPSVLAIKAQVKGYVGGGIPAGHCLIRLLDRLRNIWASHKALGLIAINHYKDRHEVFRSKGVDDSRISSAHNVNFERKSLRIELHLGGGGKVNLDLRHAGTGEY